jgi:hypothetical protein
VLFDSFLGHHPAGYAWDHSDIPNPNMDATYLAGSFGVSLRIYCLEAAFFVQRFHITYGLSFGQF